MNYYDLLEGSCCIVKALHGDESLYLCNGRQGRTRHGT
jgi:hypothetical protein